MRLTLRNLLNYMDDMLDPSDAAEIRKKVEESQFASDLLQRTRTVVGRMRLGAPKVSGRGMGVDANTVSDYLDHELDSQAVQEFEKICLESDVHLAEVAGCHQILALVLGEPANVEPAARERMYQLKSLRHEKVDVGDVADDDESVLKEPVADDSADSSLAASASALRREKPEVPDYLRDRSRMPLWSIVATILIAGAIGAGLWMAFDPNNPITAWLDGPKEAPADPNPVLPSDDGPHGTPRPTDPSPTTPPVDDQPPVKPKPDDSSVPGTPEPSSTPPDPAEPKAPMRIKPLDPMVPDPPSTPDPSPPATTPDPDAGLIKDPGGTPTEPGTKPDDPPKLDDGTKPDEPATPPAPEPKDVPPTGPVEVGRFLSADQVLIRKNPQENDWLIVPGRASLASGDRLLALPTYRPTITLSAGVTLQVPGGTLLELLPPDQDGTAGVRLYYGRLVVLNNGAVGTKFHMQLGDGSAPRKGVITFAGPASTAAIEVRREFRQGENPEDKDTPLTAELYASGGEIAWGEKDASEQIDPNTHLVLRSGKPPQQIEGSDVFAWLEADELSKRDRLASPEMKNNFEAGRSIVLALKELAAHRRFEVRSLAVRSLGHLDYFEPLVASFGDPEQKANWQQNFESLRDAITRGPSIAAHVREAFERRRGDEAAGLYRMIWGYSPEQLKAQSAERLVADLMHDDLDHRVLAFVNLMDITGFTLLYQADETALRRRGWARRWKEKLEAGEIRHRSQGA